MTQAQGLLRWVGTSRPGPSRFAERTRTTLLVGELRTGRITGTVEATGHDWTEALNAPGSIDGVTVPEVVVRRRELRRNAAAARCFLAVEQDDRIREAGPIWAHRWDDERGLLTLGAAGLWSLFDHRYVLPLLENEQALSLTSVSRAKTTHTGSLGGIAQALVQEAMTHLGGELPVVFEGDAAGDNAETFPGYKMLRVGQQLRELTQREVGAPDIRFTPRRNPADPRFLQWVMSTGTAAQPQLSQAGADWYFDRSAPRSPVLGINVDTDATVMGMRGYGVGNGTEEATMIIRVFDTTLVDAGYPLLEVEESRSSVEVPETLIGHTQNLVARSARPVQVWRVKVHARAAREVRAGDYARVVARDHAYLPDGEHRVRVRRINGDASDVVTMEVYPLQATL